MAPTPNDIPGAFGSTWGHSNRDGYGERARVNLAVNLIARCRDCAADLGDADRFVDCPKAADDDGIADCGGASVRGLSPGACASCGGGRVEVSVTLG